MCSFVDSSLYIKGIMSKILKYPKYALITVFTIINVICIVGLNVCAYSAYINPASHPNFSILGMAFPVFLIATGFFIFFWMIFKPKFMLISIVGMLLCAGSVRTYCPVNFFKSEAPEGSLKVMSFNICHLEWGNSDEIDKNDPLYCIPSAKHPTVEYLANSNADIICCQEASNLDKAEIQEKLTKIYPYQNLEIKKATRLGVLSKFPILSAEKIEIETKTNVAAAYELLLGEGDTLLLINCHLESYKLAKEDKDEYESIIKNPEVTENRQYIDSLSTKLSRADVIRAAQADRIAEFIDSCRHKKIILCGDFNSSSISYVHHRLTQKLNDAYTRSANGPGVSYYRSSMYFRIDHILCSPNFTSYGAKVDSKIKTSDHYPIYCWLKEK